MKTLIISNIDSKKERNITSISLDFLEVRFWIQNQEWNWEFNYFSKYYFLWIQYYFNFFIFFRGPAEILFCT
jgi:hypothetical protein